jgi:lipopolysaccharide export system permease protein
MLSGGVSFNRLLRPYFIAATFLVGLFLLLAHVILPEANKTRVDFVFNYIHTKFHISDQNMYREIAPGEIAYFRTITVERNVGYKFALENWEEGQLKRKITAAKARYDEERGHWVLSAAKVRDFHPDGSQKLTLREEIDTVLTMQISDFGQRAEVVSTLNYSELTEYIERERLRGSGNVAFIEIEKYSRTSNAFAIYVLTLIGVSVASRKVRGGTGLHLFFAVLIAVTYIFALKMATVAATNVGLPAAVAVWVPNMIYTVIGVVIFFRAQK